MTEDVFISVGVTEAGEPISFSLTDASHLAVQGMTRSGKTQLLYNVLSQIVQRSDVLIAGCDPSGILLAPFLEAAKDGPLATGSDASAHLKVLEWAVGEMEKRVADFSSSRMDKLEEFTSARPLIVLILEEFAALVELTEADDLAEARKPIDRVAPRLMRCLRRLVAESAKAGIRVLLVTQRAEASVMGGASRSNFGTRISFRVDNSASVSMLHPSADAELCQRVESFLPGVALLELPVKGRVIVRGPQMLYRDFYEKILAARLT